jgi:hypothetical protein
MRAALLPAMTLASTFAFAADPWPDGPNRRFFETVQSDPSKISVPFEQRDPREISAMAVSIARRALEEK